MEGKGCCRTKQVFMNLGSIWTSPLPKSSFISQPNFSKKLIKLFCFSLTNIIYLSMILDMLLNVLENIN